MWEDPEHRRRQYPQLHKSTWEVSTGAFKLITADADISRCWNYREALIFELCLGFPMTMGRQQSHLFRSQYRVEFHSQNGEAQATH